MIAQNASSSSSQKATALAWRPQETKVWTSFSKLLSTLTRRSQSLFDLMAVQATCTLLNYRYIGQQTVLINQIRGSAGGGRHHDFDTNFRLLKTHTETRWQSIYAARQRGLKLPPVSLIQVGEIYFVEDGHHRISVAKALGEQAIEADVTVWQVAGSLPWEQPAMASA